MEFGKLKRKLESGKLYGKWECREVFMKTE